MNKLDCVDDASGGSTSDLRARIRGLYALTPDGMEREWLVQRAEQALAGGARLLQYRSKNPDRARKLREARELRGLCSRHGALFFVNDDIALARECQADGLHLGRDDTPIEVARAQVGEHMLIGASCYNDLTRAQRCVDAGADYLAFGSFFPSTVKPGAVRPERSVLTQARLRWSVPVVAIGGITPENGAGLLAAGAHALAVITALFQAADTYAAARAFVRLFQPSSARDEVDASA